MEAVLITNSPGELHSWVRGTVSELKRLRPDLRVVVALVPCPYASGAEARVARMIPGVERVLTPWETMLLAFGRPPDGYRPSGEGVVVFLGGDPWHAVLLGRALRYPTVGYAVRAGSTVRRFRRVGAMDAGIEAALRSRGVDVRLVGNLTLDAVQQVAPSLEAHDAPTVGLFPGSRALHLRAALGPFLKAVEMARERVPGLRCLFAASPFVGPEDVAAGLSRPVPLGLPRADARLEGDWIRTSTGLEVEVLWGRPYDVMARMDLGLTIPGTNTAEMACLGRPMVVTMSANAPIPRGGLGGVLDVLPLGGALKRRLRWEAKRKMGFVAQPNRLAGRLLVPEIVAERIEDVVEPLVDLLLDSERRTALGAELQTLTGGRGACARMAELILEGT